MKHFRITTLTEGREVYDIEAPNLASAIKILNEDAPRPSISEVTSVQVDEVEEVTT